MEPQNKQIDANKVIDKLTIRMANMLLQEAVREVELDEARENLVKVVEAQSGTEGQ